MDKKPPFNPGAPRPANNQGPRQQGRRDPRQQKQAPNNINEHIRAREVRLVGENVTPGIYSIQEARHMADELELDLVEISPNADPPVCKILDYQKYLYQQKKKAKEIKAKSTKVVVKEIRFGPTTTTTTSSSNMLSASFRKAPRLKPTYSSKAARYSSKSKVRFCFCASLTTLRITAR